MQRREYAGNVLSYLVVVASFGSGNDVVIAIIIIL